MKGLLYLLFILLISACQVKETTNSGGMFSGHVPATNAFTVVAPTSGTYVTGDVVSITLTFPFNVTVTGTPQLSLTIGATARTANYVSGSGSKSLLFRYTTLAADNDSDGVDLNSLGLNGGTMTFDPGTGVATNCDVTTVTAQTFTSVIVDNTTPTISALNLTTIPGFYRIGQSINFTATFSEAVVVTGTPSIALTFTTGSGTASYVSGSGTTGLVFSYTITAPAADINGYNAITSPIALNGGTIQDAAGNNATLTFNSATAIATSILVNFSSTVPYVTSFTPPSDGTYQASQNMDFTVVFNTAVTVSGTPAISLTIGSTTRQATYLSGSGTNTLIFRYSPIPGESDTDGIVVATSLTQNATSTSGGNITGSTTFFVTGNNSYSVPSTTGILVGAIQPQATSVSRVADTTSPVWGASPDNVWIIGQQLLISVGFNTGMYVDQTSGTPTIPVTIGSSTVNATYLSGGNGQTTLVFRYVIQEGDLDTDGSIGVGSIALNGGNITDVANTNTLLTLPSSSVSSTTIDGVRPTISSVTPPSNGTYSTVTGNNHSNMNFTVTWSEAVNYSGVVNLPMTIGATLSNATYSSGNNTTAIIHRLSSLAGLTDTDGIALASPLTGAGTITDQAGNTVTNLTYTPVATPSILVDTTTPTVTSVTAPAAGTYTAGMDLDFVLTFSEIVNVNSSGGYPRIPLTFNSGTVYATYLSGTGTTTLTFRYTVASGASDTDGIPTPTTVQITSSGYIRDIGWNNMFAGSYSLPAATMTGIIVDALAPTVSSRTIPANGTYTSGTTLSFTTTFNEAVNVVGTPQIVVSSVQTGNLNFNYASGSGTTTLTFSYTLTSNDFDLNGLATAVNSISLNGGTIQDAAGNNATLTFTAANLGSVYITYPNTTVWTRGNLSTNSAPTASAVTLSLSGTSGTTTIVGSTFRNFTTLGNDRLQIGSAISGAKVVYIAFRTPSSLASENLFFNDAAYDASGGMTTATADIQINGVTSSGISHTTGLLGSTVYILEADFTPTISQIAGDWMVDSGSFTGSIAEIIVIEGTLTAGQKSQIMTYLDALY